MAIKAVLCALALGTTLIAAGVSFAGGPQHRLNPIDQRLAQRLILHLQDMPTGWRVESSNSKNSSCGKFPNESKLVVTGKASSYFSSSTTDFVGSAAGVLRTAAGAKRMYGFFGVLPSCLLKLGKQIGKDASLGAISFPRFGAQSSAWEVRATAASNGLSLNVYVDAVRVRVRRAVVLYLFAGLGSPDTTQEVTLVRKTITRA